MQKKLMNSENLHERDKRANRKDYYQKHQWETAQSLKYASYIQQALLPTTADICKFIPDHFIYYQPREIVGGDFYFIAGRNDCIYFAVGDCTGHGIPGAFMSIMGITFLNEIILRGNFSGASSILNQMREHVMKALCQTGEDNELKDGIDLTLCIINTRNNLLEFAGAFNPLYIISNHNLIEFQGDKMPVGIGADEEKPFTNHRYFLKNNDILYLFSDGFTDQFGGPDGKKFKYKPFRDLVLSISELPMPEQKCKLIQVFNDWKGNLRQLDDVLIAGCRYHINE
jgi:serine phosphatase RsbU (regulator of sigma subunit)